MACNIYTFADFTEVCGNNSGGIKKVVMVASDAVGKSFFTYTKDNGTGDTNFNAPTIFVLRRIIQLPPQRLHLTQ